jgi:hypothetical protein
MSIKARDVRVNIAEAGFERGVVHSLEAAIEEINALRGNLRDAAEVMANVVDQLDRFLHISSTLQNKIHALERNTKDDEPQG